MTRWILALGVMAALTACGGSGDHCELESTGQTAGLGEEIQVDCNTCVCEWEGFVCTRLACTDTGDSGE